MIGSMLCHVCGYRWEGVVFECPRCGPREATPIAASPRRVRSYREYLSSQSGWSQHDTEGAAWK